MPAIGPTLLWLIAGWHWLSYIAQTRISLSPDTIMLCYWGFFAGLNTLAALAVFQHYYL
jgi:hypothetical protein